MFAGRREPDQLRQTALGLNFIDIYVRTGKYAGLAAPGSVPGFEAAAPSGPRHASAARRPRCLRLGAHASVRTMQAEQVVRSPAGVRDTDAAAPMLKGMTAA